MPHAVTQISFEIDPESTSGATLSEAHAKATSALHAAGVGFVGGELYALLDYEGAYFHVWRWESRAAAEQAAVLRVTVPQVRAYTELFYGEPMYTEGVAVQQAKT